MIIIYSTFSSSSFVSHYLFLDIHSTFYPFPTYWYISLPSFVSHYLFPDIHSTFHPFPRYWYTFLIRYLLQIIHMFHWWFDDSSFISFRHRYFLWLPLGPWLMRFFLCITSYTRGYGFDHWVFEPSFPSFLSSYTLAYVTSRVLRPPWGHEIRRYLWQPSLGQAFVDWLKYSCYHVLFMEDTFGSIWSLSYLTYWCLMDFWVWRQLIDDIRFILLSTSNIHTGAYFPFIRLRWAPSGALSLSLGFFLIDLRSLVEYVEMISVLVEHYWAYWQFLWF